MNNGFEIVLRQDGDFFLPMIKKIGSETIWTGQRVADYVFAARSAHIKLLQINRGEKIDN